MAPSCPLGQPITVQDSVHLAQVMMSNNLLVISFCLVTMLLGSKVSPAEGVLNKDVFK